MIKFSPATLGFYDSRIHGTAIPEDAVEITAAEHQALLSGQGNGTTIVAGADGRPILRGPAARTLDAARRKKLAALASRRFDQEASGLDLAGAQIMTDRASQAMITGAYVAVQIDPARLIDFKGQNGWRQIDSATVTAIATAVSSHVQAAFSAERRHAEAIAALETIDAIDAYDITTGW